MSNQKPIAANRSNDRKNTEPTSPEPAGAARPFAFQTGLSAKFLALPSESVAEFQAFLDGFDAKLQPATCSEAFCVRQMALAVWNRGRVARLQAKLTSSDAADLDALENLAVYAEHNERSFIRASRALRADRRERRADERRARRPAERKAKRAVKPKPQPAQEIESVSPIPEIANPLKETIH